CRRAARTAAGSSKRLGNPCNKTHGQADPLPACCPAFCSCGNSDQACEASSRRRAETFRKSAPALDSSLTSAAKVAKLYGAHKGCASRRSCVEGVCIGLARETATKPQSHQETQRTW